MALMSIDRSKKAERKHLSKFSMTKYVKYHDRKKYVIENIERVKDMRRQGASVTEIARSFQVCKRTIERVLKEMGLS